MTPSTMPLTPRPAGRASHQARGAMTRT
jgi:hypothetical protein